MFYNNLVNKIQLQFYQSIFFENFGIWLEYYLANWTSRTNQLT